MADPAEITRSITDIAAGADRGDWDRVRSAFAETVTTDYTSLWGGDSHCEDGPKPTSKALSICRGAARRTTACSTTLLRQFSH